MMLSSHSEAFDRIIAGATAKFKETLMTRVLDLEAAMIEIDKGADLKPRLMLISALAHKTAGVAATLNFSEIGILALKLETAIDASAKYEDTSTIWNHIRPKLDRMLDAMESALEA